MESGAIRVSDWIVAIHGAPMLSPKRKSHKVAFGLAKHPHLHILARLLAILGLIQIRARFMHCGHLWIESTKHGGRRDRRESNRGECDGYLLDEACL